MAKSTAHTDRLSTMEKASPLRVLTYAGAIIAFLIGSGFATGQEIMQYFTSYGFWGVFGTGVLVLLLIAFVSREFLLAGHDQQFERPSLVFHHFGGKILGTFYDYFSVLFVFLSFTVMVAGAGAVFEEHYGLSPYLGGVILAVAVSVTVWFGLTSLVDVIGKIGPLIVVVAIGLGIWGIANGQTGIIEGVGLVDSLDLTKASNNWFMSALSYVGFCMLWLAAFLAALGKSSTNRKEASTGGITGGVLFAVACMIVALGLLANLESVAGAQIPMLLLAGDIGPWVATLISIMILLGIYTTAIPLLWTVSSRFFPDKTMPFKLLTVGLAILGTFIGLVLPFDQMVNYVYVINGYVGILLLVLMIVHAVLRWTGVRKPQVVERSAE